MKPWPEASEVITALHANGYTMGLLSNGDEAQLFQLAKQLPPVFDAIFSSEQAGWYKPHPGVYNLPLRTLGLKPDEVLHVAGSPTDALDTKWGSHDTALSPTFVLVNVYRRLDGKRLFHLDAYRLSSSAEAQDLDVDAMLESGPLVIEWADHSQEALPEEWLWVNFSWINDEQRDMVFTAKGQRYITVLGQLRRQVFGVS